MTSSREIRVAAPAKLNLYLHILGRRDDGYHQLDSLVCFADIHDTIIAHPNDDLEFHLSGPYAHALENEAAKVTTGNAPENLVLKAAKKLAELTGHPPKARLELIKRLPVASGIGGGSADAAATIKALCTLWNVEPSSSNLHHLAQTLGADVPVCLAGQSTYMGGIGEILDKAPFLPELGLVLLNPGIPLATPPVFKTRTGPFSKAARFEVSPKNAQEFITFLAERKNDLTAPAISLAPIIGDGLAALEQSPQCLLARMSGSGATCFGLYPNLQQAQLAAETLKLSYPSWWISSGQLIDDCSKIKAL
ncbi:MAG: 4-(cytidine 5'-diphospho)-2-C-methyl-D-erythritol kinase [Alphaproteobacteria bacterium]